MLEFAYDRTMNARRAMHRLLRTAGFAGVIAIGALSLVPGEFRPHVLAWPPLEHFAAYGLVGLVLGITYNGFSRLALITAALCAYAGLLEIMQMLVPGRDPTVRDFLVSSLGACFGILIARLLRPLLRTGRAIRGAG